ncbi:MAG: formyltetrahydrofolate deformylase [Thermostichales cyanobacterium HHBFW_bins_127]
MAARAILLITCPDRRGLVAKIADLVFRHGGNIIHADHHLDAGLFLSRIEWDLDQFLLSPAETRQACADLGRELQADWSLHFTGQRPRLAIWVSRQSHCLLDLIWRHQAQELSADLAVILSNHEVLQPVAQQFQIPFIHVPISPQTRPHQEKLQAQIMQDYGVELVILAKYMQILSPDLLSQLPPVINIHHSFLPAFPGANPYQRAHARGVKIIGATAHYATADLDEGPIIEQDVVRVSHRDSVEDLIRKGRDLERIVLARAVRAHLERRVLVYGNKTVVFA